MNKLFVIILSVTESTQGRQFSIGQHIKIVMENSRVTSVKYG